ncbi:hypothetical protein GOODEAATRI_009194 [Goodea atripinnis]|uniref:Uncharacterized protein n=1 Tax=Goodea atripinnis TaxID=208336 RepID=A0ABV0PM64_9TELE
MTAAKMLGRLLFDGDGAPEPVLCKLHDISEGEEAGCAAEPGELGGRCCTCFESGRTGSHRVAHVQSIPAREERRESIRVSLLHSCSPSLSSPSLRRPQRISVTDPGNGLVKRWRRGTCLEPELASGGITHFWRVFCSL